MSDEDRAFFLVVTIKPRPDRLREAEDQLRSMHLVQPQDDPNTW